MLVPCGSCPYRRDVPSGVWAASEYAKLPPYDEPDLGSGQPLTAFLCHQRTGALCAGWVGCHDMQNSIGLRLALAAGIVSEEAYAEALDYVSPVPLFSSGAEAAEHGRREITTPSVQARKVVGKLRKKLDAAP